MVCENFASLRLALLKCYSRNFVVQRKNYWESGLKLVIYKLFFIYLKKIYATKKYIYTIDINL